ncbi:leucine-rich repeat, cysteine-containing subtype protein [Tanacetum coccineum]
MAPTKRRTTYKATTTKHKPETTKLGEEVLDLVIPCIHNVEDRNSVSLVSRKFCEIDGITRKHVTVHTLYSNPSRLSKRFPYIESLTLKGPPSCINVTHGYVIRITPWIQQLALEFRCLKELHIHGLTVLDEDLETFARTHGNELRILKISKCKGFSTDGLLHVSRFCNQLRTLCLGYCYHIDVKDGIWLHQLALNSTVLERLHFTYTDFSYAEDLTLLAKNCCNSLISLKIGACYLSDLRDAFRYANRLDHFGGNICDEENELVNFRLPPNMRSLSINNFTVTRSSIGRPFLNQIRKLKLEFVDIDEECKCVLFKRCPNLEVLHANYECGERVLQVIGKFCKKLRKLTYKGLATQLGLIAVAKGCTKLESLKVSLRDISNEALECLGTNLKNLRKFRMHFVNIDGTTYLPLDNGIQAMLMGCSELERLAINLGHGGLSDVGSEYIGKYGANLQSLTLSCTGKSNAGLVKLSKGCPRLRKLKLWGCPFSKQVVAGSVFNILSLRKEQVGKEVSNRPEVEDAGLVIVSEAGCLEILSFVILLVMSKFPESASHLSSLKFFHPNPCRL